MSYLLGRRMSLDRSIPVLNIGVASGLQGGATPPLSRASSGGDECGSSSLASDSPTMQGGASGRCRGFSSKLQTPGSDASTSVGSSHWGNEEELPLATASNFGGGYVMGASLGSGSMATVRRAAWRDGKGDKREVAIKCVPSFDEELVNFAREEYELLQSLEHPSVIKAKDFIESIAYVGIVMEYCSDGDLSSYIESHGPCSQDLGMRWFVQLLQGVDYLHRKRVVHRDLKPENLLLKDGAEHLKIADFNSAKRIGTSSYGMMLTNRGTNAYNAPELKFGLFWNERVDIWACGMCLHYMFHSKLPFDIEDPATLRAFMAGCLPALDFGCMSEHAANLALQCLTVSPSDRPPAVQLLQHPACQRCLLAATANRDADRSIGSRNIGSSTGSPSEFEAQSNDGLMQDAAQASSRGGGGASTDAGQGRACSFCNVVILRSTGILAVPRSLPAKKQFNHLDESSSDSEHEKVEKWGEDILAMPVLEDQVLSFDSPDPPGCLTGKGKHKMPQLDGTHWNLLGTPLAEHSTGNSTDIGTCEPGDSGEPVTRTPSSVSSSTSSWDLNAPTWHRAVTDSYVHTKRTPRLRVPSQQYGELLRRAATEEAPSASSPWKEDRKGTQHWRRLAENKFAAVQRQMAAGPTATADVATFAADAEAVSEKPQFGQLRLISSLACLLSDEP